MKSTEASSPKVITPELDSTARQPDRRPAQRGRVPSAPQEAAAVLHAAPPSTASVDDWVEDIRRANGGSTRAIVELGRLIREAKEALGHGKWLALFKQKRPGFGLRRAEMLLKIGGNEALAKSQWFANLPHGIVVLYELSHIPADQLERLLDVGKVHQRLTRAQARTLAGRDKNDHERAFDLVKAEQRLKNLLDQEVVRWPGEQLGGFVTVVEDVLVNVKTG
ncbi:MAG: hypothetical protein ABMA26_00075 [Limisphaerales bacterium]